MNQRFKITIEKYHWSCGDGCCSDSGYTLECEDVHNKKHVYSVDDWEYNRRWGYLFENCLASIRNILGYVPVENEDYSLEFRDRESNGNEWESSFEEHAWAK